MCRAHPPSLWSISYITRFVLLNTCFLFGFSGGSGRGGWGCQEFLHHALLGQYSDDEKVVLMNPGRKIRMGQIRTCLQLFRHKTQIILLLLFSEWKQLLRNRWCNGLTHNKIIFIFIFILFFYSFILLWTTKKKSLISEKLTNEPFSLTIRKVRTTVEELFPKEKKNLTRVFAIQRMVGSEIYWSIYFIPEAKLKLFWSLFLASDNDPPPPPSFPKSQTKKTFISTDETKK